jgi:hypothetical protein
LSVVRVFVLSVRDLLRRADHSSRGVLPTVLCIVVCDLEASIIRRPYPAIGLQAPCKKGICLPSGDFPSGFPTTNFYSLLGTFPLSVSL